MTDNRNNNNNKTYFKNKLSLKKSNNVEKNINPIVSDKKKNNKSTAAIKNPGGILDLLQQKKNKIIQQKKREYQAILGRNKHNTFIRTRNTIDNNTGKIEISNTKSKNFQKIIISQKNEPKVITITEEKNIHNSSSKIPKAKVIHKEINILINYRNNLKVLSEEMGIKELKLKKMLKDNKIQYNKVNNTISGEDCEMLCSVCDCKYTINYNNDIFEELIYSRYKGSKNTESNNKSIIVSIIGHINHGKSSLIEKITGQEICKNEIGSITQTFTLYNGYIKNTHLRIIDSPGHDVFEKARDVTVSISDVSILVIDINKGIQEQTINNIKLIQSKKKPFIVAITKIDTGNHGKNIILLKKELLRYGIVDKEFGGEDLILPVSSLTGENIDKLGDMLNGFINKLNINQNTIEEGWGIILNNTIANKGQNFNILIKDGRVCKGDTIVLWDGTVRKVRLLIDNKNKEYLSGTSKDILNCFCPIPNDCIGKRFWVVNNDNNRALVEEYFARSNIKEVFHDWEAPIKIKKVIPSGKRKRIRRHNKENILAPVKEVFDPYLINIIFNGLTTNDLIALRDSILLLEKQGKINNYKIIYESINKISNQSIENYSHLKNLLFIGFNTKINKTLSNYLDSHGIKYIFAPIIYDVMDRVRDVFKNNKPVKKEELLGGEGEVIALFKVNKKSIAGCSIKSGIMKKGNVCALYRGGEEINRGKIISIYKEEKELIEGVKGYECGFHTTCTIPYAIGDKLIIIKDQEVQDI